MEIGEAEFSLIESRDISNTSTLDIMFTKVTSRAIRCKILAMNIAALFHSCWLLHFDANSTTVQELGKKLRVDPHLLRHTVIKLGSKLDDVTARPEKTV